ncbi:DUF1833 family protein [Aliarcobacter lanthieri]|uniref:DUF1833 family protein n=1 Tax=Aliarcobacter lanthieri TaxID=1355374 RepID=UPI003AAE8A4C
MALQLSPIAKVEKNKLTQDSVFLSLLEITIPTITDTIYLVSNNEDINWRGEVWQRFPFEVGEISEASNAEVSQITVTVSNVNNMIGQYIRQYEHFVKTNPFEPIRVKFYIVNSKELDNNTPIVQYDMVLSSPTVSDTVVFSVSSKNIFASKIPKSRMLRNSCRFKFKDNFCRYLGDETECNKSLARCKQLGNSARFGGSPTIGNLGVNI